MSEDRGTTIVLAFHRVAAPEQDPTDACVPPELFAAQMARLVTIAEVVPLGEVRSRSSGGPRVAITFDDGYADNEQAALPVLEAAGLPATFFVPTGVLDGSEHWWDHLEHLLLREPPGVDRLDVTIEGRRLRVDVRSAAGCRRAHTALMARLQARPPSEIRSVVESVAAQVGHQVPPAACDDHAVLTAEQVTRLAHSALGDVGSHSRTHAWLAALDAPAQREEVRASRAELEQIVRGPVRHFAYPFGPGDSYDGRTVRALRAEGYDLAVTTSIGPMTRCTSRYRIPRYTVRGWTADELEARVRAWLG